MRNMFLRKIGDRCRKADKGYFAVWLAFILMFGGIVYMATQQTNNYRDLAEENLKLQEKVESQSERIDLLLFNLDQLADENDKFNRENEVLMEENEKLKEEIDDISHNSEPSPNERIAESKPEAKPEPKEEKVVASVSRGSHDRNILAKIINAESKGESMNGKIAVGNVVLNRVKSDGFPDTIESVVYQPGQFQPVTNGSINQTPSDKSIEAARRVLDGEKVVGDDVIYFYNPAIATDSWIFTRTVVVTIGNHAFAK